MKASHFRHQSDSRYCFALGEGKLLLRLGIEKDVPIDTVAVVYGPPQYFERVHTSKLLHPRYDDGDFIYYETILEERPARYYYIFEVWSDKRRYIVTETGITESYDFSLGFLSAFQMIAENRADFVLPKPSWQGRVLYQIFPERFASRDDPKTKDYVNRSWDSLDLKGNPPIFLGGDLWGVIDKLDYLAELGVTGIYLNPIHPSPSNHKYDVLDYFDVDPTFGGKEAFKELVKKAHEKGIKIIMDMVFNHTASSHPFFQDVIKKGRASLYHEYYMIHGERPHIALKDYETFANVRGMPKLDTSNLLVQHYIISVCTYWVKEFGVDGFRLDVCEGVSHECWMKLKMALRDMDPELLLIGEVWLNSESYLGADQIDGVMNYPLLGALSSYVLHIRNAKQTAEALAALIVRYKEGHNEMMLNLLSSHDIQRFTRTCNQDRAKVLSAYAAIMAFPGMPCIYYGDEIFMDGGNDPDCRRGMMWDSPVFASEDHAMFKQLIAFHNENDVLRQGEVDVGEENGLLYIQRTLGHKKVTLYLNQTDQPLPFEGRVKLAYRYQNETLLPGGFLFQ